MAPQSRGPYRLLGPGSAQQRYRALQRVRDTRAQPGRQTPPWLRPHLRRKSRGLST